MKLLIVNFDLKQKGLQLSNDCCQNDSGCFTVDVYVNSSKSMGQRKKFEVSRIRVFKSSDFSRLTDGF